MFTVQEIKSHLTGMGHGATLNKVRNINEMFERSASRFLAKCKPVETIRTQPLSQLIHDDLFNYALPSDYNSLIDLIPQDDRQAWDMAYRRAAGMFDLQKAVKNRILSIEGSEGSKIIRINWKSRSPKLFHNMNSLTSNGTWSAVGTASGLAADSIAKRMGSASIRFDVAASGDGIQNTAMTAIDFTNEDEIADLLFDVYIRDAAELAKLTSITPIWGIDLATNYFTGVAQTTQADGTAFRVGWNTIKAPWSTATETGTVTPTTINSLKFTIQSTGTVSDLRIDNVRMSIGRAFEMKYFSKYLFKSTAGVYKSKPTTDEDYVTIDNDSLPIFLFELLKDMAHQVEGTDSAFDIQYAERELVTLYPAFKSEYPDQRKKMVQSYSGLPRLNRRRF